MQVSNGFQPSQQMPQRPDMPPQTGGNTASSAVYGMESKKWNRMALISLGTAVFSLFIGMCGGLFSIPFIVVSGISAFAAFYQLKKDRKRGRELVLAAVIIDIVAVIIVLSTTSLFVLFAPSTPREINETPNVIQGLDY
jgi:4-hydroxybenzoate polyprenyltransferase